MARIVLISDEFELSQQLTDQLEKRGHVVIPVECMEWRVRSVMETHPDLCIVDFASMSREAASACQRILAGPEMRCSMLGIFGALDAARGLSTLVNVADTLAQKESVPGGRLGAGDYGFMSLDVHRREVIIQGHAIPLTPTETHILSILATHPGSYVTAQAIVAEMYGCDVSDREAGDNIRVHVYNLRRKFEKIGGPPYIVSMRGKGYLLERRKRAGNLWH
jgi:DNA-binding response OmpR family regulator